MTAEFYKLATLPVTWVLLAAYAALELRSAPLLAAHAMATIAAVAGGRDNVAASLCAVPSRHRLFAFKVLTVALLSAALSLSARCLLLSLFALGLALLTRGVIWPLAFLAGVPILLTPILRAVIPTVEPYLPHEATAPVLAGWAATALAAAWLTLVRRDA
ncbi:hypothetical protein ACPPVO_20715 [Dactylosporangium sp. McL0621]|uniref:hypothetical protein n=1 Tax=Dactylosporangium sp. McL0621 TaxID=3415678 RepID=UPI003CF93C6C